MSNRNILNQNINGRNILNIKNKNLLDGNAIKISDRNNINIDIKTNTTEQTTIGADDLFLISDVTGKTIKYIKGLNLKQQTNNSLIAGNNINFTTNNNNTVINVKDVITSLTSINGFTLVTNISSAASQFLLKDNSVGGFANGTFLTTNANGLIVPTTQATINSAVQNTILGGNNITKSSASGNATLNLDATLTSITSINGYNASVSTVNNSNSQFLLKSSTVGSFPNNGFLTINGSGLIQGTTQEVIKTFIHSSLLGGTNITKNTAGGNATFNLNAVLTGLTSIDGTSDLPLKRAGVEKIKLETNKVEFKENSATLGANLLLKQGSGNQTNNEDYEIKQEYTTGAFSSDRYEVGVRFHRYLSSSNFIQFFCGYQQSEGQSIWLNPNNDLHYIFRSGVLKIRKPDDSSHNFSIQLGNDSSTFVMTTLSSATFDCATFRCCSGRFHGISSGHHLFLFNGTQQTVVGNNINFLEQYGDGSLLKLRGTTIKLFSTTNEIISLDNTAISCNRKTIIQPTADIYTNDEFMLHIKPFQGKDCRVCIESDMSNSGGESHNPSLIFKQDGGGIKMEQGINSANQFYFFHPQSSATWSRFRFHCGSTATDSNGQPTDASLKLSIEKEKVIIYKTLGMEQQPINLYASTDTNHQILYSGSGMNGVLIRGFGNDVPFFRLQGTSTTVNVLDAYIDKVVITKPLEFNAGITDTAQIDYNNAKQLSINIVEGGEVRIDNGGANYFKTIAQGAGANGRTFFFEQGGDSGQSNGGSFQTQCSRGKMLFQGDRNLVIYNPDNSVAFSANDSKNAHSSRDYKTNINDLVENESVNIIKQINPVSYEYKEDYYDDLDKCTNCNCNLRKGFVWEDIKPILPQCAKSVNMNNPDYPMTKLLDLREIIPDLVKTVQYLMNEINILKKQINNSQI